jgi:hypothetical protein
MRLNLLLIALSCAALGPVIASSAGDKLLFNGRDLAGWKHVGPGEFVIENGMLKSTGGMGLLYWSVGKLGNGVLRVVYKSEKADSNGGVFIRIPEAPTEPWMPVNRGYEVEIDDSGEGYGATGVLYSLTKAKARPARVREWNTLEITLDGPRTLVTLNGEIVTDHTEGEPVPEKEKEWEPDRGPRPAEGFIGLQNHADKDVILFKEISFRSLGR